MFRITNKGDFRKSMEFLRRLQDGSAFSELDRYGKMGVDVLARATPVDTALTANSWGYRIIRDRKRPGIEWYNTNMVNGTPVAILIQYGHATGTGGYVHGRDFINPAMQPFFDQIGNSVWGKVVR